MLQLSNVKPEQMKVIKRILERYPFIVLPTGYGKSTCFQSLPLVYDQLLPESDPSLIVAHSNDDQGSIQWGAGGKLLPQTYQLPPQKFKLPP